MAEPEPEIETMEELPRVRTKMAYAPEPEIETMEELPRLRTKMAYAPELEIETMEEFLADDDSIHALMSSLDYKELGRSACV
jgi:hypothetical protein